VESRRSLIFPFSSPSDIVDHELENQILASKDFFGRSTRVLEEADSDSVRGKAMMTVAQQVAHTHRLWSGSSTGSYGREDRSGFRETRRGRG